MPDGASNTLVRDVLTSRVYDVARETPLELAPRLSRRLDIEVLLKREDLQPVFSFKLRGAYNRIAHLRPSERARGVIAASAGNHAQGVAFSARHLGLRAVNRDADDDARDQGRGGSRDGRRGGAVGRQLLGSTATLRRARALRPASPSSTRSRIRW
jgi:tryptophan synthase beta subunit